MKFTKMHGLGNDFVIVAGYTSPPDSVDRLAVAVCDRHFGIGADGLVFLLPSSRADFQMRIFNADGSEAEQCGNAVRCIGAYAYNNGLTKNQNISIETKAGIQHLVLTLDQGLVTHVRVDMGEPILEGSRVPTTVNTPSVVNHPIQVGEQNFAFTAVSMGNPHAVIFVDRVQDVDLHGIGPRIETDPLFPRKTNVEFVEVHHPGEVTMYVWERGCGETLACGTGACATGVAGVLTGRTSRDVIVHLKGGDLRIEWSEADGHVYMTGPAVAVFSGEWLLS